VVCPSHQLDRGKIIGDHMTYGYEIKYECDDGYILVGGDAIRSCSSCGEWTGKMPTCAGMLFVCSYCPNVWKANFTAISL